MLLLPLCAHSPLIPPKRLRRPCIQSAAVEQGRASQERGGATDSRATRLHSILVTG